MSMLRQLHVHQNVRAYRLALAVCQLVWSESLVDERSGDVLFTEFDRENGPLAHLFESFIRNFLRLEQNRFSVSRPILRWAGAQANGEALSLLPRMATDVVLDDGETRVVIEVKFYK